MEFLVPTTEGAEVENKLRWVDDCDSDDYIEDIASNDASILTNSGNGADDTDTSSLWEDLNVDDF